MSKHTVGLRDVYDTGAPIEAVTEVTGDGTFVKGPGWEVVIENRGGTVAVVIWNRNDGNDPDLLVNLPGNGPFERMKEVTL